MSPRPLTRDQRAAAHHSARTFAVVAGPGSGKTRVLVYRVVYAVEKLGVTPERIVVVTFTNRAANELRHRLGQLLGTRAHRIWVGTFHALGLHLLREHHRAAGLDSTFAVLGPADQERLLAHLLRIRSADAAPLKIADVRSDISTAKQHLRSPADETERAESAEQREVAHLFADYEARLAASNAVDLDDLITRAVHLLRHHHDVRRTVRRKFTHVLVDEFQDTNAAQGELLQQLVPRNGWVTVVGDDDQAIYGWRGADAKVLSRFRDHYDAATITLGTNHRSTAHIVAAAASVVAPCVGRVPRTLVPADPTNSGRRVRVLRASDEIDEAERVARRLRRFHKRGIPWREMAVLFRTHAQAQPLADALAAAKVPCRVAGRPRGAAATRDDVARAWLRLAAHRHPDDAAVLLTLGGTAGIGDTTVDKLVTAARERRCALVDLLRDEQLLSDLRKNVREAVAAYVALVKQLQRRARRADDVVHAARRVLERVGVGTVLRERIVGEVRAHCDSSPPATLSDCLAGAQLAGADTAGDEDAVTLLTMHAAKGLEFEAVIVTGVEVDLVPLGDAASGRAADEERRLLYVAMTRAKCRLTLTYARWRSGRGSGRESSRSPFLDDLGEAAVWC